MAGSDSLDFAGFVTRNKRFEIPPYQRNYSWEQTHVNDLWEDLVEAVEMDREHYIGTFLLMEETVEGEVVRKVIDGQQRLTTLTILLFELQRQLDEHGDEGTAHEIRGEYVAKYGTQKLTLGGDDEQFFRRFIMENVLTDQEKDGQLDDALESADPDSPSQRRLKEAKEQLREHLAEGVPDGLDSETPVAFYRSLYQKIQTLPLLEYTFDSRSEAARIFQTVNDRGKDLTDLEITKSYLMHRVSLHVDDDRADALIRTIQESFNDIYDAIENIPGGPSEDRIQRYHFILWDHTWGTGHDERHYQNHLEQLKECFRSVTNVDEIISHVQELRRMFQHLDAIYNYETNVERDSVADRLERLFFRGRLGNFYPLLMAAYDQYDAGAVSPEDFCRLLDAIETSIVRTYIIEQKSADTGRTRVYPRARELYYNNRKSVPEDSGIELRDIDDVIGRLQRYTNRYCDDDHLESTLGGTEAFNYFSGSRKRDLRLLLYTYERKLEEAEEEMYFYEGDVIEDDEDRFWIEHVWPQTPSDEFDPETKALIEEHKHRLGSLALMTHSD